MKKLTKKVQAKIELLELADKHAFLAERKRLKKLIKTIDDKELEGLVTSFVLAKEELEIYLETIRADVAYFLPDDSDS